MLDQLTDNGISDGQPAWSPEGKRIAFTSDRAGDVEIFVMRSDGSQVEQLTDSPDSDLEPVWSPDGLHLAFTSKRRGNLEVSLMDLADGKVRATGQRGIPHGWRTDQPLGG